MKTSFQMALAAAVAAVLTMFSLPLVHAMGGSCLPRDLTAEEKQAGERVLARLRPLLPPAPGGWKIDGADTTDIASGKCLENGKSVAHLGHEAYRPWNPGVTTSRVQDVNVRVDGNAEVMQALIDELKLEALDAIIER
jgi:hypothetical protein